MLGELDDPVSLRASASAGGDHAASAAWAAADAYGAGLESLIPSILEQKVTTEEAYRAWRLLVRKYGEPAPGPAPGHMYVMPEPRDWALIPSWEWHRAGVDNKRASTILRAVRVARRLEEAVGFEPVAAQARLELVSGDRALDLGGDRAAESWGGGCGDRGGSASAGDRGVCAGGGSGCGRLRHVVVVGAVCGAAASGGSAHSAERAALRLGGQPRMPRGDIGRL